MQHSKDFTRSLNTNQTSSSSEVSELHVTQCISYQGHSESDVVGTHASEKRFCLCSTDRMKTKYASMTLVFITFVEMNI